MNKKLHLIKQRVGAIENALLRFKCKHEQKTLHVRITVNEDNSLNCKVNADQVDASFANKKVSFIQKSENDYLYLAGKVSEESTNSGKGFSINLDKACWFERKTSNGIAYLQQKYIYDPMLEKEAV